MKERNRRHKRHHRRPDNPQWISIYCHQWHRPLVLLLGDAPITIPQGSGGWQEVARPQRRSIADWPGVPLWKLIVPVMLDGYSGHNVHTPGNEQHLFDKVHKLLQLGRPTHRGGRPPRFHLYGWQIPPAQGGKTWVMESLDDSAGGRIMATGPLAQRHVLERAVFTINAMEYQAEDDIKVRRRRKHRHRHHHHGG